MRYGRYEIVKELGKGNMGVVYQAHDPNIDRMVALKVLRPDRVADQALVARFMKEAKAIGRLSHPGIVTVYDVGKDRDTVYIAMEYVTGRPLDEVIRSGGLTTTEQAVEVVRQVAEALDYAHSKGIVHRDVKPSNIIIDDGKTTKLTDFGIAHMEDPAAGTMTQAGEILGTPAYMSPEQVKGQSVDGRSDLFSLGVILYELVVGQRPFGGNNLAAIFHSIAQQEPKAPAEIDPFVSKRLSDTIVKAIAKDPEQRFQSGREMSKALQAAVRGQGGTGAETGSPSRPPAKSRKGLLLAGAAGVLAILVAVVFLAGRLPGPDNNQSSDSATISDTRPQAAENALLNVTSEPAGADIFINGTFRGKTPLQLQLPLGKYNVALSLKDYYEWEAQLQFDEPGSTPLHIRLVPIQ